MCTISQGDGLLASGFSNGGEAAPLQADPLTAGSPGVLIRLPSRGAYPVVVCVEVRCPFRQLNFHIACVAHTGMITSACGTHMTKTWGSYVSDLVASEISMPSGNGIHTLGGG